MVFALPTMATTDAMHTRVAQYADLTLPGSTALTKVHSTSWPSTPDPGETNDADGDGGEPDSGTDLVATRERTSGPRRHP